MYKPFEDYITDITPEEFEKYVEQILHGCTRSLDNCEIKHNQKIKTVEGEYQIDILICFDSFGVSYQTLVECKMHRSPIKREFVQVLYDKIRAIGAHKGILFSAASFQKGAITYAKVHGIALIQIIEGKLTYLTKSFFNQSVEPPSWANIPKYVGVLVKEKEESIIENSYDTACIDGLIEFLVL